jgi:hypothetical protein
VPILGVISVMTVVGVRRLAFRLSARRAGSRNSNGGSLSNQTLFHDGVYSASVVRIEFREYDTGIWRAWDTRRNRWIATCPKIIHESLLSVRGDSSRYVSALGRSTLRVFGVIKAPHQTRIKPGSGMRLLAI